MMIKRVVLSVLLISVFSSIRFLTLAQNETLFKNISVEGSIEIDAELKDQIVEAVLNHHIERSSEKMGSNFYITPIRSNLEWQFGITAISLPTDVEGIPDSYLYIGQKVNNEWVIAVEYTTEFANMVAQAPIEIMDTTAKELYNPVNSRWDNGASLNLPFPTGETWNLTGGPHNRIDGYSQPWGAIDFNGISGSSSTSIRSARDGTGYVPCANFIRIDHAGGWSTTYYHVANIAIGNGQGLGRNQHLGNTSAQVGCGGSASGPHVHFAPRYNGADIPLDDFDLGGWRIKYGAQAYQGCMIRNVTGEQRCVVGPIKNYGEIGYGTLSDAPYNNWLVKNHAFNDDKANWSISGPTDWATYAINGNKFLAFKGRAGGDKGTVYQALGYRMPAGSVVEMTLRLGNSSSVTKTIRAHVHRVDSWDDMLVCEFSIPPNSPLQWYTLRRKTTQTWPNTRVWIESRPADGKPDVHIDDVTVRRYKDLNISGTQCFAPSTTTSWFFDQSPQGWSTFKSLLNPATTNEGTKYKVTGDDPFIYGPTMLGMKASEKPFVNIVMRSTAGACGQIYFRDNFTEGFTGPKHVAFDVVNDGALRRYVIDMRSNELWTGNINQLRFDPSCNSFDATLPNEVMIRSISLASNGTQLISNANFETKDDTASGKAGSWIGKNLVSDSLKCDKPEKNKFFARTGKCAFRFKADGTKSLIKQNAKTTHTRQGDSVKFSVWLSASNLTAAAKLQVKLKYTDGTSSVVKIDVPKGTYAYQEFVSFGGIKGNVAKAKVKAQVGPGTGKLLIDDISLHSTVSSTPLSALEAPIELAPPPEDFRPRN